MSIVKAFKTFNVGPGNGVPAEGIKDSGRREVSLFYLRPNGVHLMFLPQAHSSSLGLLNLANDL